MATKQKYTNRAKATIWNKSLRMETEGSIPGMAIMTFEMINTIEEKEQALAQMQQNLDKCKEREAANADVQTLQKGE
ncbi:hypothetical protein LB105_003409 [Salmonella enterica]|uniref:Uncharacterized protein n=1 Tax=Salmonella enterica subsp. enterica serovar Panama TaxID=29472 RepID=A0A5U8J9E8_SALET|nr:hypothetical protein [Salmonella enterica]EBR7993284.1 hypothetical protein [Salmonella enterica subsp. enterica serovar Panama]ECC9937762.1 hypothetical protein [Salmonella enterica subsp. enterica]EEN2094754.1 hypothetical protein [Salmonella enterica subsp. enterica serovar Florida]ASD84956.1 hypothetical protein LFZ16_01055 [Salmonella enterica subsp. enterica serovar India str. SA20085604]EBR8434065.1 hypothetical protein [Salmonella enterica subsp. enterica serovar Panama]